MLDKIGIKAKASAFLVSTFWGLLSTIINIQDYFDVKNI